MKLELELTPTKDDFTSALEVASGFVTAIAALPGKEPEGFNSPVISDEAIAALRAKRDEWVAYADKIVVNSPDSLEACGALIDAAVASKKAITGKLTPIKSFFHNLHKKYSGLESDLNGPIEVVEKKLRSASAAYRERVKQEEARRAREAEEAARAEAKRQKDAEEAKAAEAARAAAQEAEQAAINAAAAAAAGDLDAQMEAEAMAEEAAHKAAEAGIKAAAVAAEPLRVQYHAPAPSTLTAGAGGGSLQYKWVAEPAETEESKKLADEGDLDGAAALATHGAIMAIAAALPTRPDLVALLALDLSAATKMVSRTDGVVKIPGIKNVKKPVERRTAVRSK